MTFPEPGADETIRLRRELRPAPGRPRWVLPAAALGVLCLLVGIVVWWPRPGPAPRHAVQHAAIVPVHPVVPTPVAPAPVVPRTPTPPPAAPEFTLHTADEAQIRNHASGDLTIFRFAPDPDILVLDFASLREQGMMLDRVAALTEKRGLPHERVIDDATLDAAIRAGGDTLETYYYGHDYSVQELVRFFKLADADHISLHPEEKMLRRLMRQEGWFKPGVHAALISIPQAGGDQRVTMEARSTILRHELSHGLYFSDPAYAAFVHRFWDTALTADERTRFRRFLASEDYDTGLDDLVINEMQAYLMFTRDPEFFVPSLIGMTPARRAELQAEFARSMPAGWLRDALLAPPAVLPVSASAP